ncbi:Zn-ribbon-containing [Psychrobacter aquaticus]|uniref:Zn-ribbon-containing n=1 Tax=Psychrobacter aquaticus CMS 56 TaxID=1354303 RepID=U4T9K6_9GAMM|nr:Zn-ribbon-containing [Psychrobacter aquaticus]ERL56816.1 Zn-ribbon-containing [Psychrobacter aquaticus CMS 56]
MSKKQPNRLAQLIDHQAFAGSALPQTLADNIRQYIKVTNEVKELLVDCLPEEILNTCWVVGFTSEQLTLSVGSITAANHIRYLQSAYLQVLTEQSITFKQLKQIRVVVAKTSADNHSSKQPSALLATLSKPCEANKNQALSQNTKRTISQAAEHVTTDENLKKALLRLANH